MNCGRLMHTAGLFLGGTLSIGIGIQGIIDAANNTTESPIALIETGSILFPLAILIGIAAKKIFEDMGWQSSPARDLMISSFTIISATALASAAAVGFGFTFSLSIGLEVVCLAIEIAVTAIAILIGTWLINKGLENVILDENHQMSVGDWQSIRLSVRYT
jgi:hypothetical protein